MSLNWTYGKWVLKAPDGSIDVGVLMLRASGASSEADLAFYNVEFEKELDATNVLVEMGQPKLIVRADLHRPHDKLLRFSVIVDLQLDAATKHAIGQYRITQYNYDPSNVRPRYIIAEGPGQLAGQGKKTEKETVRLSKGGRPAN